jgi:hypothetical protein
MKDKTNKKEDTTMTRTRVTKEWKDEVNEYKLDNPTVTEEELVDLFVDYICIDETNHIFRRDAEQKEYIHQLFTQL